MARPRSLKLGGHRFTVSYHKGNLEPPNTSDVRQQQRVGRHYTYFGDFDPHTQHIRINSSVNESYIAESLMHESLHVLFEQLGLRSLIKRGKEEAIVQSLGHGLTELLKKNPTFRRVFESG